jgi:CYTH domain-containing protein
MPLEIERKFLVNAEKWQAAKKPVPSFYRQGYLVSDPNKTIRVRQTDDAGYLTIKGLSVGATRAEFEYEIPKAEAGELLDKFAVSGITKQRYKIEFKNKLWEVDEFLGENAGLLMSEIELKSEIEPFELPDWVEREVTGEERYYNSNLAVTPFKSWR